jgi:multiple sugar transport system substrate-binding protein
MSVKRRVLAGATAVGIALTGLPLAAGATAYASSTSGPSGTITWDANSFSPAASQALGALFHKTYPSITVNVVQAPSNEQTYLSELVTQISGGASTPDVFMGDVIWPSQFETDGLALTLNHTSLASVTGRFNSSLISNATVNGNLVAIPLFVDQGTLYYRSDLLKKAHLPVPATWSQLQSEAITLVKDHSVKYGYLWDGSSSLGIFNDFTEWMADAGGSILNSSGTQATLDTSAGARVGAFMRGLLTSGASPSTTTAANILTEVTTFAAGDAAFMRSWDFAYAELNTPATSQVVGKFAVAPMPSFTAGKPGAGEIGGWDLYINPHSKNAAAAELFVNWLSSTPIQVMIGADDALTPANSVAQKNPAVVAKDPLALIPAHEVLVSRPKSPAISEIGTAIAANMGKVETGSISVQAGLKATQSAIDAALTKSSL